MFCYNQLNTRVIVLDLVRICNYSAKAILALYVMNLMIMSKLFYVISSTFLASSFL